MAKTKEYSVQGKITLQIDFEVEGISQEDAQERALKELLDMYNLRNQGMPHFPETVVVDIDVEEIEYED